MGVILSLLKCQIKTFGRMQIPEFMPKKHVQVSTKCLFAKLFSINHITMPFSILKKNGLSMDRR